MNIKVNIQQKERFIKMLLACYSFKIRESRKILLYLLEDDHLLSVTHFVNNITNCPRSITMSTTCVSDKSFNFIKGNISTANGIQAFHDLRLNNDEPIYIKINFSDQYNQLYYAVLEKNPYIIQSNNHHRISGSNMYLIKNARDYLQQKIDQALDDKNMDDFMYFSNELKKL